MSNNPVVGADLILKLYDLRRESEIRKARHWWLTQFWPESVDEILKIAGALGSQENNWLRQVGGYWEMAASLVHHGSISPELFLEPSFSGEMFFYFAKFRPFLNEFRERMQNPRIFRNVETLIMSSEDGKQLLKEAEERLAARRKAMAETRVAKAS